MVLKWNPMSKNLQICIRLLILLVIFHSKPASTRQFGESLRYSIPDGRVSTTYYSTSVFGLAARPRFTIPQSGRSMSTSGVRLFGGPLGSGVSTGLSGGISFFGGPSVTLSPLGTCTNGNRGFCVPTKSACREQGGKQNGNCKDGSGRCCKVSCTGDEDCPPNLACIDTICNKKDCTMASDCQGNLVCEEGKCIDPCDNPDNPPCGTNAICSVDENTVQCRCPPDFEGNPNVACTECESDSECSADLVCIDFVCIDPCEVSPCGLNAVCTVVEPNGFKCDCLADFTGDPLEACFPARCNPDFDGSDGDCLTSAECANKGGVSEGTCFAGFGVCCSDCERNEDCPTNLACIGSTCQDPCPEICGDQDCTVEDHIAECKEIVPECKFDDECPSKLECRCREAADFNCIDLPCDCDENCPDNLSCTDSFCSDPCENPEACGVQATCTVVDHEPVCDCPPDFTGDPDQVCFPTSCDSSSSGSDVICYTSEEECSNQGGIPTGTCASGFGVCCLRKPCDSNTDCPSNLACIDSYCSNPCGNLKTCGFHAMCAVHNHHPYCFCPDHYTGNASDICFPTKCKSACGLPGDCLSREACSKQYGIPNGSCASGLGVCCLDSKYCDHPGYANKLPCKTKKPATNYTYSRDAEVVLTKKNPRFCTPAKENKQKTLEN